MEENLVYKLCRPIMMGSLPCSVHQQMLVTKVCSEITCTLKPLMCARCLIEEMPNHKDHSQKLVDYEQFIVQFTSEMQKLASQNKRLYTEFLNNKDNILLMHMFENEEETFKKMEQNIQKQKSEITKEIAVLLDRVSSKIKQISNDIIKRLDEFSNFYRTTFKSLKNNINSFFYLSRKNYYQANANTFQLKLMSSIEQAQVMIQSNLIIINYEQDLKQQLNVSRQFSEQTGNTTPLQILTDMKVKSRFLLQMSNQPPNYDKMVSGDDSASHSTIIESMTQEIEQLFNSQIADRLFIPINMLNDQTQIGSGTNNLQIQIDCKEADEFFLKPLKKYQLDFPISSLLSVTDTIYVLASTKEPTLRIFDCVSKKVQIAAGHQDQVVYLEKLYSEEKQKYFASVSCDKQVLIWIFEDISQFNAPKIYRRFLLLNQPLQILDLKDLSHLAVSFTNMEISVCNITFQKVSNAGKSKHTSKVNGLTLLKQGEKFISFSQNINIWRLLRTGNSQEPILICDQTVQDPSFGIINQLFILKQWPNQCIWVNHEGEIKVFDLVKQKNRNCVVFSQYGKRKQSSNHHLECVLIEEMEQKILSTIWMISFNDISYQHRLTNQPYTMHSWEVKLEHKLNYQCNQAAPRPKVQIFQTGQSSMIMFSNEVNQELLVYDIKYK